MGDVTSEAYDKKQKEELIKNRRYFNMPNEDGSFSMMGQLDGKFPTDKEVTTEKKNVLQNMKFDSAISADILTKTGDGPADIKKGGVTDWNKFTDWENALDEDEGNLLANLKNNYDYTDVEFASDDGNLIVTVGGTEETYPFSNKDMDKNALMKQLKEQLSTSKFDDYNELTTLGDDSSTWMKSISSLNKDVVQNLSETDMLPKQKAAGELLNQGGLSEEDALKNLSLQTDQKFTTKAEYKAWFMENNNGLSESVDEAQFNDYWKRITS